MLLSPSMSGINVHALQLLHRLLPANPAPFQGHLMDVGLLHGRGYFQPGFVDAAANHRRSSFFVRNRSGSFKSLTKTEMHNQGAARPNVSHVGCHGTWPDRARATEVYLAWLLRVDCRSWD